MKVSSRAPRLREITCLPSLRLHHAVSEAPPPFCVAGWPSFGWPRLPGKPLRGFSESSISSGGSGCDNVGNATDGNAAERALAAGHL